MRLGIDLGGTKIEIIALDAGGAELYRNRVATPQGDYRATLNAICDLVNDTEQKLAERGSVGIGTPGAISRATGRLKNSNSVCLNGQPLDFHKQGALHSQPRNARQESHHPEGSFRWSKC